MKRLPLAIGGIKALGLLGDKLRLAGWFWEGAAALNENFNTLGFVVIGVLAASWAASVVFHYARGYDRIEAKAARPTWARPGRLKAGLR